MLASVSSVTIGCSFANLNNGYTCTMSSIMRSPHQQWTATSGHHISYYYKSHNVQVLRVISGTSYLPNGACNAFKSLAEFEIASDQLKEITRNVFTSCGFVKKVSISNSQLEWIAKDLFDDLVSLNFISITDSNLEFLPEDLFSKNLLLKSVNFDNNLLIIVNTRLSQSVSLYSLRGNVCIDKRYPGDVMSLELLQNELTKSCTFSGIKLQTEELNTKISKLESKVNNINEELNEAKKSRNAMQSELNEMTILNKEKSLEIQLLTANHSETQKQVDQLFTDIVELKQNNSHMTTKLSSAVSGITSLIDQIESSEVKISALELEMLNKVNQFNATIEELNLELSELSENVTSCEEKNGNIGTQIFELELNMTEAAGNCSEVLQHLSEEISELTAQLTDEQNSKLNVEATAPDLYLTKQDNNLMMLISYVMVAVLTVCLLIMTILFLRKKTFPLDGPFAMTEYE